uniref:Transmembrane protein 138 n=1 Tax=Melopsittacus undulatus TaxID=13146 RepID=A0A8V5G2Z9_MELUD
MLQTSNYSLVLFLQFLLLFYDLFVNSFSELLRTAPAVQLVLFIIQDIAILFNVIIVFLMFFNTFVFQAGLVNLLFHKFKGTILLSAAYLGLSISFHVWVMNLRWRDSSRFVWTEGLQTLFVFQRLGKPGAHRALLGSFCFWGAPGDEGGCSPSHSSSSLPQRPCSTATSTRGLQCIWGIPSSTRTPYGCVRSLSSSGADGSPPAPQHLLVPSGAAPPQPLRPHWYQHLRWMPGANGNAHLHPTVHQDAAASLAGTQVVL